MITKRKELILVSFFSFAAALRVFLFAAALPFFSDVDEDLHFDLVLRYSHGQVPRAFDLVAPEALDWIVPHASPEFLQTPDRFPGGNFGPPLWKRTGPEAAELAAVTREDWGREVNSESSQPPIYYLVAGLWWRLGQGIGLSGIDSLYWIRFLNIPLIAAVVWLGYWAARIIAPDHFDLRMGVPLCLAFIPQSVFSTINNDVLSPICAGALFLCLLRWWQAKSPTLSLGAFTGLAVAITCLTKLSNLPLVVVVFIAIGVTVLASARQKSAPALIAFLALILCAAIPIGGWLLWTRNHFGDLTGSATKITLLGWTRKPVADWWAHPIFTPRGFWIFWSDLLTTFWRGELKWQSLPLRSSVTDAFCSISSMLLLGVTLVATLRPSSQSLLQRKAMAVAALSFLACVVFFGILSLQFDFGHCINPSREHPYFTSGRLLNGALIPFALIYVYGIVVLFRRILTALPLILLASIMMFVTISDVLLHRVIFASEYNWFHR